jgi:hypothetical protein
VKARSTLGTHCQLPPANLLQWQHDSLSFEGSKVMAVLCCSSKHHALAVPGTVTGGSCWACVWHC